jgi:large subunit ribosomal protein L21
MYAIVKTGGKQYRVAPGDVLSIEKVDAEVGKKIELPVICVVDGKKVETNADAAAATKVEAMVLDQYKGDKQLVFKFKKRKNYKRLRGHRQSLTRVRIVSVGSEKYNPKPAKKAAKAEPAAEAESAAKTEPAAKAEAQSTAAKASTKKAAPKASTKKASTSKAGSQAKASTKKTSTAKASEKKAPAKKAPAKKAPAKKAEDKKETESASKDAE